MGNYWLSNTYSCLYRECGCVVSRAVNLPRTNHIVQIDSQQVVKWTTSHYTCVHLVYSDKLLSTCCCMCRSHNIWVKILVVEQVIMLSKQVQTRQTWTEQEREEIRAQNKLHLEYSYPVPTSWFEDTYLPSWTSPSRFTERRAAGGVALSREAGYWGFTRHSSKGTTSICNYRIF